MHNITQTIELFTNMQSNCHINAINIETFLNNWNILNLQTKKEKLIACLT